jgi:hypothetical protein
VLDPQIRIPLCVSLGFKVDSALLETRNTSATKAARDIFSELLLLLL